MALTDHRSAICLDRLGAGDSVDPCSLEDDGDQLVGKDAGRGRDRLVDRRQRRGDGPNNGGRGIGSGDLHSMAGGANVERAGPKGLLILNDDNGALQPRGQNVSEMDWMAGIKVLGNDDWRGKVSR